MSDRRYDDWQRRRFSEYGDPPTLELAQRATELLCAIFEQANYAWDYGFKPVSDPESCQCIALRSFAALDYFFHEGGDSSVAAMALARDRQQNVCANCLRREQEKTHASGLEASR